MNAIKPGGQIMVTGANGQLGRAVCNLFDPERDPVLAYSGARLDITSHDAVEKAFSGAEIRWLINCAAYTNVDGAEQDFSRAMEVNAIAVGHLAMICRDLDIPMIHISTDYVYDNGLSRPLAEDDPTRPKSIYAITKLAGEEILRETWRKHLILRTSWLYSHEGHNFPNTMLRMAGEGKSLNIVHDQVGAPTYVEDLADAIKTMIEQIDGTAEKEPYWGTYNISNAGQTSWYDYAKTIFSIAGIHAECIPTDTETFNASAQRPRYSVLSNDKLKEVFGIQLQDWQAALKKCLSRRGNLTP